MLKITLIAPPQGTNYPQPPLGLVLLAAILEKHGYPVNIIDANALQIKPEDITIPPDTDIVGITAMTPTIGAALPMSSCQISLASGF